LVSERTVEENILKKANQKRILGDIAIEGGNFTTAFFKKQTIHDLFTSGSGGADDAAAGIDEEEEAAAAALPTAKKSIGAFESALATAEDDSDRQATSIARAEENLDEADFNEQPEEEDQQFAAVLAELSSVERYALRQMREQEQDWARGQLQLAEAEIQARKEEFDADKLDELTQEIRAEMGEEETSSDDDDDEGDDSDDDSDSNDEDPEEGDYRPEGSGTDDEETIGQEEKEVDDKAAGNPANEIHMLENEAEVPIEELLRMYYPDQLKNMLEIEVDMDEPAVVVAAAAETNGPEEEGRKKTRSRGTVEINLWNLGTKKQ
jgi:hypothetical protein